MMEIKIRRRRYVYQQTHSKVEYLGPEIIQIQVQEHNLKRVI
jgi:hypothetical protein